MINEIYNRLKIWREARNITVRSQQEGYLANISMEIGEVGKEIANKNDAGVVAELCDCLVIAMNCYSGEPDFDYSEILMDSDAYFELSYLIFLKFCANYYLSDFSIDDLYYVYSNTRDCLKTLGYDFEKAMDETLKKIESREGYWDESQKKWIKTATKYTPDYESCRL